MPGWRRRVIAALAGTAVTACAAAALAPAASASALYQHLTVSWSHNNWKGHDTAGFQIPGVGNGNVTCSPNTTWIQMVPSNRNAENDMWSVLTQRKNGILQTAVKDARVYRFSTPTSTVPHGTGASAYEGFNMKTPVEKADSGSLVGLISNRSALNKAAGAGSVPTAVRLSWSWSRLHTKSAQCKVTATFVTPIAGKSRFVSEGRKTSLPLKLGAVSYFNINWHGESDYTASTKWPDSLSIPGVGELSGVCATGTDGDAQLQLTPIASLDPFAQTMTYQGQGIDNSQIDDYYTDPDTLMVGPIPLPTNGFMSGTVLPAWNAPASRATEILVSSIRKTNDPNAANDYCEVAVEAISAPDPLL
jgi:hypothetical protein